jgi:hypothetical protein
MSLPGVEAAVKNFENSFVALYLPILLFLGAVLALFVKRGSARTLHAILHPDEVANFTEDCEQHEGRLGADASYCERLLQRSAHSEHAAQLQAILAELRTPLIRIDAGVEAFLDRSNNSLRRGILQLDVRYPV